MDRRLGFIGIIIEDRKHSAGQVNSLLSDFGDRIVARTGVPQREHDRSVITLVIEATTDEVGRLTGKLGSISGVSVKSALSKQKAGGDTA
ncbi:MAG: TM1266 family iron-only hydrogenase system putative regulator [Chitinivibrionales bacterium]